MLTHVQVGSFATDNRSDRDGEEVTRTTPAAFAAFLRDVVDASTRHQATVAEQVPDDGFVFWCDDAEQLAGVTSPLVDRPDNETTTVLRVPRPGQPPRRTVPEPDPDPIYQAELQRWHAHKQLYDDLFGARSPGEGLELVVGTGLVTTHYEGHDYDRHIAAAPAEVSVDVQSQALMVSLVDTPTLEVTWLPPVIRQGLTREEAVVRQVVDAQSFTELFQALRDASVELGTDGQLRSQRDEALRNDAVALTPAPAVLLRKKDTSALLQMLTDMTDDIANGGFVSEPFKMLLDTEYEPEPLDVDDIAPALPLPANGEQRVMIDRARRDRHMVVQGPPGTGKTHTIANLASVLMAEGRRVLITAENDRALGEVQGKLPGQMQPLMLPMLQDGATAALGRSVSGLLNETGRIGSGDKIQREDERLRDRLEELAEETRQAEEDLVAIADADREERRVGGHVATLAGHLINLRDDADRVDRVVRLIGDGRADPADGRTLLELTPHVSDTDRSLLRYTLPTGLDAAAAFGEQIGEFRREIEALGHLEAADASELVERREELLALADRLAQLPAVDWAELVETSGTYQQHAERCAAVASDLDHGVAVVDGSSDEDAIEALAAYLALEGHRFAVPIARLLERHERAACHLDDADEHGRLSSPEYGDDLLSAAEEALRRLELDRSGLLERHVNDMLQVGTSSLDLLAEEARQLLDDARAPSGLPVIIDDGAPPAHELLAQANRLLDYLQGGGKMTRLIGTPKPVKEAEPLLDHVTIDGSVIDTVEEAERAVAYLRHLRKITVIDNWARQHELERPGGVVRHDWIKAICQVREASEEIVKAVHFCTERIDFEPTVTRADARTILQASTATVAAQQVEELTELAASWTTFGGEVRRDGRPVDNRTDAAAALAALQARVDRETAARVLPDAWRESIDPWQVVGTDHLVAALEQAAAAASVPGPLRDSRLSSGTVRTLINRATTDARRREVHGERDQYLGNLLRITNGCVPASPATSVVASAVDETDPIAYRHAIDLLDDERERQMRARQLDDARRRLNEVHPTLVDRFDSADAAATVVLDNLGAYQKLATYHREVLSWSDEVGSASSIHNRLSDLHKQTRRAEASLASVRAWGRAVARIAGTRSAEAALSRLTIAVDRVPRTRTAKSYPRSIREVRNATKQAAPSIPCWVMPIERIAEALGYPTGNDRFDVVIVDEASQAWFPSVFLYAIADQVIVVGDDLQTSPSSSAVAEAEMRAIVQQHIANHRLADQAGGDLSLYDVAATMSGPTAMTDHFRCVPEIIALSNVLSYEPKGKKLMPSRVRTPGGLTPVRHVRVGGGGRSSPSGPNQPEVDAIIEQVVACHMDDAYRDMTFGVVVVGPKANAHLKALRSGLLDTLGATALEERDLVIGTSAQFQGAERDVMFLSFVAHAEAGQRIRKWPHEHTGRNRRNVQRLNVAVSRARDQLWLFRSFDKSALPPGDARTVLLDEVPAASPDLQAQLDQCDSQFERDVVTALKAAEPSLQIRTQVEAIGYSIDLVLEDVYGHRLAVECDGDRWHTTSRQIRNDLYRQRTLESIGWRFHRFLASEWYADVEGHVQAVLNDLSTSAAQDAQPLTSEELTVGKDSVEDALPDDGEAAADWDGSGDSPLAVSPPDAPSEPTPPRSIPRDPTQEPTPATEEQLPLVGEEDPQDVAEYVSDLRARSAPMESPEPTHTGLPRRGGDIRSSDARPDDVQLFAALVMAGITRAQVAEAAGVTMATVRRWAEEASIPSLGRGNRSERQLPHAFLELASTDVARAVDTWPHTHAFPSDYVEAAVDWWKERRGNGQHPGLPLGLRMPTDRPTPGPPAPPGGRAGDQDVGDRPTPGMPPSRLNRRLAKELRALGKPTSGPVWQDAKARLKTGRTFNEAAREAGSDD